MAKQAIKKVPDPVDKHVGSRFRARRVGLRMSQTALGKIIGVTFQQVQKYENGSNRIGASKLFRIAEALEVDVGYFFEGLKTKKRAGRSSSRRGLSDVSQEPFGDVKFGSDEAIKVTYNYFRIKDEGVRRRLFQLVRTLSDSK